MLKKATVSPAQPRRAVTRHSAGKAAANNVFIRITHHTSLVARTPLADFFSIRLVLIEIPIRDVRIDTFTTDFAIGPERRDFIITLRTRALILVRIAPGVFR